MILSSSLGVWLKHQFSQTPRFLSEIWLKFWNLEALIWVENGVDYIKDSTANFLSFHLVGQNPYQYLGPTKRTPGCKKCKICHFNVKYDCGTPLGWTINCSINQSHLFIYWSAPLPHLIYISPFHTLYTLLSIMLLSSQEHPLFSFSWSNAMLEKTLMFGSLPPKKRDDIQYTQKYPEIPRSTRKYPGIPGNTRE